jgi:glutathione peroxidase
MYGVEPPSSTSSFLATKDKDMNGDVVPMSKFAGCVLLVVNVSSKCGLTKSNYTELPQLYDKFGDQGLKILAFPCNQFAGQEPGSHAEILEFVKTFDPSMDEKLIFFEKADVNGAHTREPYLVLKKACPNEDGTTDIRWNFGTSSSNFCVEG